MSVNTCSIVVCTYNRLEYLKKCLASLLKIDFPQYEIIIVNDGSTDGTRDFLNNLSDAKIKVIHNPANLGASAARNAGIRQAQFEIIAFTDDDCQVEKNWLSSLVSGFSENQIAFVIGQTFYVRENYRGYFPERLVSNIGAHWPMGCNIAFRKSVFSSIGFFDEAFFKYNNEDSEMAIRALSQGYSFNRAVSAIVFHQAANWTPRSLLKSARNPSIWPILKKKYPRHYNFFRPPIKLGLIVSPGDYFCLLAAPILIPALLIRYLLHGKKDFVLFFAKWPIYLLIKRCHIYHEAIRNRVLMF